MMQQLTSKCPNCGKELLRRGWEQQQMTCAYCGKEFTAPCLHLRAVQARTPWYREEAEIEEVWGDEQRVDEESEYMEFKYCPECGSVLVKREDVMGMEG